MSKEQRIEALAAVLFSAWKDAEPNHSVTLNPVSYMSTFVDMARAAIDAMGPKDLVWAQIDGVTQGLPQRRVRNIPYGQWTAAVIATFPALFAAKGLKACKKPKTQPTRTTAPHSGQ